MSRVIRVVWLLAIAVAIGSAAAALAAGGGSISTVAGSGVAADAGDGGPATAAALVRPYGIDVTTDGGFLIADWDARRVRRVAPDGTISTVAGTGVKGYSGDGGPATGAQLSDPVDVSATADGGFLIADWGVHRIRRVAPDGTITTVAGTGTGGFSGDGGPATAARLAFPTGVAAEAGGGLLIADWLNQRVRRVAPDGTISTVAGTGIEGFSGDGGPAPEAQLDDPLAIAALPGGGFLITDHDNARVRRVGPDGVIATVAGIGTQGFSGDGGPAITARLDHPVGVDAAPDGSFLIADRFNQRIRQVAADGTITTVAGTGLAAFGGDGGPATAASLDYPSDVALLPDGAFLVADESNHRVRLVSAGPAAGGQPPRTVDASLVAQLRRPGPVSALGDRLVWSEFDPETATFVLMTRAGGITTRVPVAPRRAPFDVDLGTSRAGHVVAAYSRCATEPSTGADGLPRYDTGDRCAVYTFDFTTGRQARLRGAGSAFLPSVSRGHVAFARRRGTRSDLYLRSAGGPSRRVARSLRAVARLDLSGRRLAYAANDARGHRAVWLTTGRAAARRVSPRGAPNGRFASPVLSGGWLYFTGRGALWRYRLATGARESAPLPRQPVTMTVGARSRAFVLILAAGPSWELRAAGNLHFAAARPAASGGM